MSIVFPSREFDEAVAAACDGRASEEQLRALNAVLLGNPAARDEYIMRVELHARLASDPDLFFTTEPAVAGEEIETKFRYGPRFGLPGSAPTRTRNRILAFAAVIGVVVSGWWGVRFWSQGERKGATSTAVALLNRAVDARWDQNDRPPRLGAPLEPGAFKLRSGLAQVVFFSGARVVIEGPAEFHLLSQNEAFLSVGRLTAEVPAQARGFHVRTPQAEVKDLGSKFGLEVKDSRTEVQVFKGRVTLLSGTQAAGQTLVEGSTVVVDGSRPPRPATANPAVFASLFDLQNRSGEAETQRYDRWRDLSLRRSDDQSLLVSLDFERHGLSEWKLPNTSSRNVAVPDATVVGCQWIEGRWPTKQALEFRNLSDRVRLSVPGEFESLTMAAWVRVQGLDRQINSLFMPDGFAPGTIHWSIRNDGVLVLTVIGQGVGNYQIVTSPPVLTVDQFGMWLQLAVVVDGRSKKVVHYVNGQPVFEQALRLKPPFHVGVAELGNWNADGFPGNDPFLIRNFSGAMDEFCLFGRALSGEEIRALYLEGRPQSEPTAAPNKK